MNNEEFINELEKFRDLGVDVDIRSNFAFLLKKKTFKIDINFMTSLTLATIYKRTEHGGYKEQYSIHDNDNIINEIKNCLTWPVIEKSKNKFNKDMILQNIIAREVVEALNKIGHKSRIKKLAINEECACIITAWSFQVCHICPSYCSVEWRYPCSTSGRTTLPYNMKNPSFDPNLLIKSIIQFSKNLNMLANKIKISCGEVENNWHLEKRNVENDA